jgi:3-oxoacyl-[acyl-carrier-protein] synthase-3
VPEQLLDPAAAAAPATTRPLRGAALVSVGTALPPAVVSNDVVAERIGKSDDWIHARTGIRERRCAAPDERLADLAVAAAQIALERAAVSAAELDLVILGTLTADELMPNAASLVAHALGAERAGAIDVNAACTAFVSALALAAGQIESGRAELVLVIGADFLSRITDHDSKQTAMLFADGAGAVVLSATGGAGRIGPLLLRADAAEPEYLWAGRDERIIQMDGHATFKHAVNRMVEVTHEAVAAAGLTLAEIDLFAYHQANGRILRSVVERLELDEARVVDCIEQTGNMSAASVPYALDFAYADGRLRDGARVLLCAFGGGFTWGGGVVEWGHANG